MQLTGEHVAQARTNTDDEDEAEQGEASVQNSQLRTPPLKNRHRLLQTCKFYTTLYKSAKNKKHVLQAQCTPPFRS